MYKFKNIKRPVSIKQGSDLLNVFSRLNEIKILREKRILRKYRFLQLSIKCNKDVYGLNPNPLETLYYIGINKKILNNEFELSLLPSQKLSYAIGLFISTLKLKLIFNNFKIMILEISKLIIKIFISITDTILIFIISTVLIIKNKATKSNLNKVNKVEEIYSIYYWKNKNIKSIIYYYPDFYKQKKSIAYIQAFYQYRYFSIGLLNCQRFKKVCTAIDFINFPKLIHSFVQLFLIYLFDLRIFLNPSFGLIIRYFESFGSINCRLISLLNYNSAYKLSTINSINHIYIWFENQTFNKGLMLGFSKFIKNFKKHNIKTYIYYGFIFTKKSLSQYKPTYSELLLNNYLTNNFLHQNSESVKEMENIFAKSQFSLNINYVRETLKRYKISPENEQVIKNKSRNLTIFSGYEINELSIIFYRLIKYIKNNPLETNFKVNTIYIRLHPTLNENKTLKVLLIFAKNNNLDLPFIKFIQRDKETIISSLINTEYAIFGNSAYINLALSLGLKVLAIKTNFLNNAPIYDKYLNSKLIKIIN